MLYKEYRCPTCDKLLFKGLLVDSTVEAKCRGCGNLHSFFGESKDKLLCFTQHCPNRRTKEDVIEEGKKALA